MDTTNTSTLIIVAVVFLIVGGLLAMAVTRLQRSRRLKERFGPEYERALDRAGDKRRAEAELEARMAHVQNLNIRALSAEEVNRFSMEWQQTQTEFVDRPLGTVQKADQLIREVMSTRGYPMEDFEQRAADISVDYPELVTNYRQLHAIASKGEREQVSTEEMRQAMLAGRELFERLVQGQMDVADINQKERV
jgi:hypothetical protein